jgi:hypothetical protein
VGPLIFFVLFVAKCWRSAIIQSQLRKEREMKNEYVIYWREEVLYRSKIIATSEEEARSHFLTLKENNAFKDDVDLEGEDFEFSIDNVECLEEGVDYD